MFPPLEWLIVSICNLIIIVVLIQVVMSWLFAFNVLNAHSRNVQAVYVTLTRLIDPMTRPLRRFLPQPSGVDISPMVLLLIVGFVSRLAVYFL